MLVGALAFDLALPNGIAAGIAYILPVLLMLGTARRPLIVMVAGIALGLVVLGALWSPGGSLMPPNMVILNRALTLVAIVATAVAVLAEQRASHGRSGAHEALGVSEERFRIAFEQAPFPMAVLDVEGRPLKANTAMVQLLGYAPGEVEGRPLSDFVHPSDLRTWKGSGLHRAETARLDARLLKRDGTSAEVEGTSSLLRDAEGNATGTLVELVDVTRRRHEERARREIEERFRLAFSAAPFGMALLSPDGRYLEVNDALCALLARDEEDVVGRSASEFVAPEDREQVLRRHDELVAGQEPSLRGQERLITPSGEQLHVIRTTSLVRDRGGEPRLLIAHYEDVTRAHDQQERGRKLEEQLRWAQRMEAVGRLAGGVAHDFNNMLSVILSYSMLAEKRLEPDHPARRDLAAVRDAAQRAAGLTKQLLMTSGRHTAPPEVLVVDRTIEDIVSLLRRTLGEDVVLDLNLDSDACPVRLARPHLEQILMNLAVNARDAMPGGGRLSVESECVDVPEGPRGAGRFVRITVHDTGAGMPPDVQARAFEPFYTTKEAGRGTGLGLSIVYGIVEGAGGWIELDSEPGRGTTFRITLPAGLEAVEPEIELLEEEGSVEGRGEWILAVEDEPALRQLTARVLRQRGYNVVTASDGLDALEKYRAHGRPIDLLLTDVVMPRMSGRELAARLESLQPGLRVLYVSGHADERIARHQLLHTRANLLSKPFHIDELLRRVRAALDGRVRTEPEAVDVERGPEV